MKRCVICSDNTARHIWNYLGCKIPICDECKSLLNKKYIIDIEPIGIPEGSILSDMVHQQRLAEEEHRLSKRRK
jgi:hypothetical protein